MKRRLVVFAHFDRHDLLDNHVVYFLNHLKKIASDILFISTAQLSEKDQARIRPLCAKILCRENIGYDFMSWKMGLDLAGDLSAYEEVVICNDSVYGPLFSLTEMFQKMSKERCDFWGITDNDQFSYHIQSYFVVFKKAVFHSKIFNDFWKNIRHQATKNDVIIQYEVGLYTLLTASGFRPAIYFEKDVRSWLSVLKIRLSLLFISLQQMLERILFSKNKIQFEVGLNTAHFLWKDLLRLKIPFLKVELLRENPYRVRISETLREVSDRSTYPTGLIENHLIRVRSSEVGQLSK